MSEEGVPEPLGLAEALALLAFRHQEQGRFEAGAPQAVRHPRRVRCDGRLRDNRRPATDAQPGACGSGRVEETGPIWTV